MNVKMDDVQGETIMTVDEIYENIYGRYSDILFRYDAEDGEREIVLYADTGNVQVISDESYTYRTWDDMLGEDT